MSEYTKLVVARDKALAGVMGCVDTDTPTEDIQLVTAWVDGVRKAGTSMAILNLVGQVPSHVRPTLAHEALRCQALVTEYAAPVEAKPATIMVKANKNGGGVPVQAGGVQCEPPQRRGTPDVGQ